MIVIFTYVDSVTKRSIATAPSSNMVYPDLPELEVVFYNESDWPTSLPLFWGKCADFDAEILPEGVIEVITQEQLDSDQAKEMSKRSERELKYACEYIQAMLDGAAKGKGYDSILSACTYATSTVPTFAEEGQAFVEWRDQVWSKFYEVVNGVKDGTLEPEAMATVFSELPELKLSK